MSSVPFPSTAAPRPRVMRLKRLAVAVTALLMHAAIVYWQMTERSTSRADQPASAMVWVQIRPEPPRPVRPPAQPESARRRVPERAAPVVAPRPVAPAEVTAPRTDTAAVSAPLPSEVPVQAAPPAAASPSAQAIFEQARRDAGAIDRALRKEQHAVITAPLDSPQLRMREKMEEAQELAAPRLWEAPKVAQLVNQTADGARRTRVITGRRTYCVTERSGATSIDMIEKHGRQRLTNCPQYESTARAQRWRTARD